MFCTWPQAHVLSIFWHGEFFASVLNLTLKDAQPFHSLRTSSSVGHYLLVEHNGSSAKGAQAQMKTKVRRPEYEERWLTNGGQTGVNV
jgi:hypothetical protein